MFFGVPDYLISGKIPPFRKVSDDATIPTRSTKYSAGYDIYSNEDIIVKPNEVVLVKTGVSTFLPSGCYFDITARSGLAVNHKINVVRGVVDADYYPNEIGVIIHNMNTEEYQIKKGDRIAQGIVTDYKKLEGEEEPKQEREGGFGSTGK